DLRGLALPGPTGALAPRTLLLPGVAPRREAPRAADRDPRRRAPHRRRRPRRVLLGGRPLRRPPRRPAADGDPLEGGGPPLHSRQACPQAVAFAEGRAGGDRRPPPA